MGIISRYLSKEFVRYFSLILIVVIGIYTIIDFTEKIDNFISAQLPMRLAFQFFLFNLPGVVQQLIPLVTLLAVVITFGLMSKNNELVALKASGVSLMFLLGPVLRFGLAALLGVVLMAEVFSPLVLPKANDIWIRQVKQQKTAVSRQNDIWLKVSQGIIHLRYYLPQSKTAQGVTIHWFDQNFNLMERIEADSAVFINDSWVLRRVMVQIFDQKTDLIRIEKYKEWSRAFEFTPDDLDKAVPRAEEMSLLQLYQYIKKVETDGYDATRYRVDFQAKIAFPFSCILMVMIGAGLAAGGKIKEGLPISISYGIGIAFLYWITYSFCVSLGYADKLPPLIAVWAANVIGLLFTGFLILNAE